MCIFCKIIDGDIPSHKIYEDEIVIAILDISQANKGHTLVIPKKHFCNILDIDEVTMIHVFSVAKRIAEAIDKVLKPDGINILNNCKEAAGQSIDHFHVHVIPRFLKDDIEIKFHDHQGQFDLQKVRDLLKEEL